MRLLGVMFFFRLSRSLYKHMHCRFFQIHNFIGKERDVDSHSLECSICNSDKLITETKKRY